MGIEKLRKAVYELNVCCHKADYKTRYFWSPTTSDNGEGNIDYFLLWETVIGSGQAAMVFKAQSDKMIELIDGLKSDVMGET